ncbi:MAG: hypothetical protein IT460_13890 [Planctomycetes bacterium]|nr:hypothetical protein [Planctomycetota bacterium]
MTTPPARFPDASPRRQCGTCDLCCRLPSIDWEEYPELEKAPDVPCRHLVVGTGCRIHPDRPMHCATFQCLWLMGFGPDDLKPDRIGGFFDATDAGALILLTDKDRPDPRTIPAVATFIRDWTKRRGAELIVYRGGREVPADRPDAPRGRPPAPPPRDRRPPPRDPRG